MDSFGYELTSDNKIIITKFIGSKNPAIVIPSNLFGKEVVGIKDNSFLGDARFSSSVEIQSGIRYIGKHAFARCSELAKVTLPSTIEVIDDGAFADCNSLEEVRFMGNIPKIGKDIFKNSLFVTVFYYGTSRGWDSGTFAGRPAQVIAETDTFLGESDDEDAGDVTGDFFGEDELLADEPEPKDEQQYEEDMFEYEEPRYMAEVNVFQRVGVGSVSSTSLKNVSNPIEAFKLRVGGVFNKIKHTSKLSEADLAKMLEPVSNIPNIRFKNPAGFILGYIASDKGKKLSDTGFKSANSLLELINDVKVIITPPDIIRYASFWLSISSKYLRDS